MIEVEIEAALKALDRRLRLIEVVLARKKPTKPALPPGVKRSRGRPKGSKNAPSVILGDPLFSDNALSAEQLVARSVLEGWLRDSERRRPVLMHKVVGDQNAWRPPQWGRDRAARALANLSALHSFSIAAGEQLALVEALKLCEHAPVDNYQLARRGLDVVAEAVALRLTPHFTAAA